MKLTELARTLLTVRESARRIGCNFNLRPESAALAGVAPSDMERVMAAVMEIENFTSAKLAELTALPQ